jgi:hypothetical protein
MRKAERDLAQESAAGPPAILTKLNCSASATASSAYVSATLIKSAICQALGLRLREDPLARGSLYPDAGLVHPVSILPRAEPPC